MHNAGKRLQLIALSVDPRKEGLTSKACAALHSPRGCMSIIVFMLVIGSTM